VGPRVIPRGVSFGRVDELLELIEPGATLHLDLVGGGAVEGEYVRHDAARVTIRMGGEERAFRREKIADATLLIRSRAAAPAS
jgi:hypothetical protein